MIGALFLGTLAISSFSLKIGVPAILGVLLFGLVIPTSSDLFSHEAIEWMHTLSLAMLVFYSGLRTELRSIRGFLEYGVLLAVGGVFIATFILGMIIWFVASPTGAGIEFGFNQMPLSVALLIASCLGATDASATMSVLETLKRPLPQKLQSLLDFESSVNDPSAILCFGIVLGLFSTHQMGHADGVVVDLLKTFLQKVGSGLVMGVIVGYAARYSLEKIVNKTSELLILGVSIAMLSYGLTEILGGSGLIAAFVTGMLMGNHNYTNTRCSPEALVNILLPFNTMTEITVFLIFGLMMQAGRMFASLPEGIMVALGMMLLARPLSVMILQPFSPFSPRESLLVGWCGLRGAVPLAMSFSTVNAIPTMRGVAPALVPDLVSNSEVIVFTVVVLNLMIQGFSMPSVVKFLATDSSPVPSSEVS
jgi:cell volume regulation protein A